jgi:uncharacterized damage-inducible protein DinB
VADPTLEAARDAFEDSLEQLRSSIEDATPDVLNRRPAGDDTNSIAVLATHAMLSTRMWLGCALDVTVPPRDRPSEFLAKTDGWDALLAVVDAAAAECRAVLATDTVFEASAARAEPLRARSDVSTETVTAGWALMHAIKHLGEHAGQATLTRQLLDLAL